MRSNNSLESDACKATRASSIAMDFMKHPSRLLLIPIFCMWVGHAQSSDWKRQLDSAEARWHNRGVVDYRMTVKVSRIFCPVGLPETHELQVTVSSGAVIAIERASIYEQSLRDYSTVHGLFGLIRLWTKDAPEVVDISFDAALGFPRSIRIDPDASATDDELIVEVQAFEAVE